MNRLERHLKKLSTLTRREFVKALPKFRDWCKRLQWLEPIYLQKNYDRLIHGGSVGTWCPAPPNVRYQLARRARALWECLSPDVMEDCYGWPVVDGGKYFGGKQKPSHEWKLYQAVTESGGPEDMEPGLDERCWNCGGWTDDPEGLCQGCATGDDGGDYPDPDPDECDYDGWDPYE